MKQLRRMALPVLLAGIYLALLLSSGHLAQQTWTGSGLGWVSRGIEPACTAWQQVNANGFGLPTFGENGNAARPYENEDGFEVAVFRDQLYVGMEADDSLGARLWRTRAGVQAPTGQADWEEVIADGEGRPWGQEDRDLADHIDSLAEFDGYIYASVASKGGAGGVRIYRSSTGAPIEVDTKLRGCRSTAVVTAFRHSLRRIPRQYGIRAKS
jgi:hypothetical protein